MAASLKVRPMASALSAVSRESVAVVTENDRAVVSSSWLWPPLDVYSKWTSTPPLTHGLSESPRWRRTLNQ